MTKNKSRLKEMTLRTLIMVPRLVGSALTPVSVMTTAGYEEKTLSLSIQEDIVHIREKVQKIFDLNIKRLEKVKIRLINSGKTNVVHNVDKLLHFFKREKPQLEKLSDLKELSKITENVENIIVENDVVLGKVFDKKDSKTEKMFNKLENKLDQFEEDAISRYSDYEELHRSIQKSRNLIEQLRNEEKHGKARFETKILRRELTNTISYLSRTIR